MIKLLRVIAAVSVFSSSANAQTIEETAFFLATGTSPQEHGSSTAKTVNSLPSGIISTQTLTMEGSCKFTLQNINKFHDKQTNGRVTTYDFSRFASAQYTVTTSGVPNNSTVEALLHGEKGLMCTAVIYQTDADRSKLECPEMAAVEFLAPIGTGENAVERYKNALAYFRDKFCKGRAF